MSCAQLESMLVEPVSAEAKAHARTCPECGPVLSAFITLGQSPEPAPRAAAQLHALRGLAEAELAASPKPRPWWAEAAVLSFANMGVAVAASVVMTWASSQHDSSGWRWGTAGALLLAGALGAVVAVMPGRPQLRWAAGVFALAAMVATIFCGSGDDVGQPFLKGLSCATTECFVSIAPLLVASWVMSRFSARGLRLWLAGASVGAAGVLALHLHCPNGSALHLATFHVLPWLAVAGLSVLVRRFLPTHAYAP